MVARRCQGRLVLDLNGTTAPSFVVNDPNGTPFASGSNNGGSASGSATVTTTGNYEIIMLDDNGVGGDVELLVDVTS